MVHLMMIISYAPALRGLRQVAQIVTMRPPSAAALSARLKAICDAEGLSIDLRNLMDLCDYTLCDVRASLHALQVEKVVLFLIFQFVSSSVAMTV